jgi:gliding motility-associated-like protein
MGTSKTLQAGNFSSYRWQNGSTSPSFTVNAPGVYYVAVRDANQCEGSDTTRITTLLSLPSNFLPADTFICSYGKLDIQPKKNYNKYLWSNNAGTSFISVNKPGVYSLKVTDENNCTGEDSIIVSLKDCLNGFYIPTAFSPNNDGVNDFYKPVIGGNVIQYQFTIYNRWGEIIFTSNELNKGWNGYFKGSLQESHAFVWTCRYQLEGEPVKNEMGTVVLVK